jgi:protoporphyrinogen IX oxidase
MIDPGSWLKVFHIFAFAAWMAGLWYLPRLLVYHSRVAPGSEASETFKVMERRLLRAITTPAMVATILLGVALGLVQGQWSQGWLHAKTLVVLLLAASHGFLARMVKAFAADRRPFGEVAFRWFNEVPTVLFVGILVLVIFRPS